MDNVIEFPARTIEADALAPASITITGAVLDGFSADHGLTKLSRANGMPTKIAYWVSRIMVKMIHEAEIFNKTRQALVEEFCDKDADGKPISTGPGQIKMLEHRDAFVEEMNKLAAVAIDLGIYRLQLPLSAIPDGVLSGLELMQIAPFADIIEDVPAGKV